MTDSYEESEHRPHASRAEARRAAQRGGGRRRAVASAAEGAESAGRRRRAEPEKKRFIDYPRSNKRGARRWMPSWKQLLGTALTFFGVLLGLVGIAYLMVDIPDQNIAAQQQKNVYYWADGSQMVVAGGGDLNRQNITIDRMPKHLQESVISAENHTFREDRGVDPMGIARAVYNMARGGDTQSGSTITQQYVKNNHLSQEQTLERKAKELLISIKVGAEVSKDDILEGYLNTAYFGRGAYGIQAAARAYYDKNAEDLDASESAFLTTLLRGPDYYDPYGGTRGEEAADENLENAERRWKYILDRRVQLGNLDAAERAEFTEFPMPQPISVATDQEGQIGYLVAMANSYLTQEEILTSDDLDRGGYEIHTTFDKELVDQMEASVNELKEEHLDPEEREEDQHVQFAGASVVPGDGAIVAMYGGVSATEQYVNNANRSDVQVGSTFKPFVLAAALRDGVRDPDKGPEQGPEDRTVVSPESLYNSEDGLLITRYNNEVWEGEDEDGEIIDWRQNNFEGNEEGDITLRRAMEVSSNSPFVQLGMDIGIKQVGEAAIDAGLLEESLGTFNDTVPSFSLGVSHPSAIRMAGAYGTFAASGEKAEPYSVTRVEGPGEPFEHEKAVSRTFDTTVADTVTDVLVDTVANGSGEKAAQIGKPVAAKTGTTDDNRSAWFIGYTPHLSTSMGMFRYSHGEDGGDQGFLPMRGVGGEPKINGSGYPADVWVSYMKEATKGDPATEFPSPGDIGEVVYGGGAEEPPPPVEETEEPEAPPEETEEPEAPPEETNEPEPPPTETEDPEPPPGEDCREWDPECNDDGPGGDPGSPGDPSSGDPSRPPPGDDGPDPTDPGEDPSDGIIPGWD